MYIFYILTQSNCFRNRCRQKGIRPRSGGLDYVWDYCSSHVFQVTHHVVSGENRCINRSIIVPEYWDF